ncbi:TPA: helix-turn-helix domain-containing protein [Escherichia coli]|nr:helix-turn-helix domain-containing protein [Escherichia coli]HDH7174685.1 helix-turn-helix domain-containing protein [Escherichia coli]
MTKAFNTFLSAFGKGPADTTNKKEATNRRNTHKKSTPLATVAYVLSMACHDLKISRRQFARDAGLSHTTVNRLLRGEVKVTPEIALRLEYYTGIDAAFWLTLQLQEMRETTDYGSAIHSSHDWGRLVNRFVSVSRNSR